MESSSSSSSSESKMTEKIFMSDQIGFVELLETFGDDLTVVNAARVSFDKVSYELSEADKKLINYLAKHEHTSPFFHPQVRLRIKMPLFVAREWFRHTIGFARNEVSRRYVDSKPQCWLPSPDDIRERDPKAKQGSKATPVNDSNDMWELMSQQVQSALQTYDTLLEKGVAPEVARSVLPQSMYTEFIETCSLAAAARLCHLRLSPDAQKEIRNFANALNQLLETRFPVSWKALQQTF
jgi:thymidylate synthase (FAD)